MGRSVPLITNISGENCFLCFLNKNPENLNIYPILVGVHNILKCSDIGI